MAGLPHVAFTSQLASVARQNAPRCRHIHASPLRAAVAHPVTAHGPPPKAPAPSPEFEQPAGQSQDAKSVSESEPPARPSKVSAALKKRFWKDVHVHEKPGRFTRPVALLHLNWFDLATRLTAVTVYYRGISSAPGQAACQDTDERRPIYTPDQTTPSPCHCPRMGRDDLCSTST